MPATGSAKQFGDFIVRQDRPVDADFVFRLLPRRPTVAFVLREGSCQLDRREVFAAPYLALNTETHVNWITVDVDRLTTVAAFLDDVEALGLPAPAFVVRNDAGEDEDGIPRPGRLHATWCLSTPVQRGRSARALPMAFLARIRRALARALGADPGFTNTLVKNPLSSGTNAKPTRTHWTGGRAIELAALADRLDLEEPRRRRPRDSGLGRNSEVFDRTRAQAYDIVDGFRRGAGRRAFETAIHETAHALNGAYARPLGLREIATIARSVSKWTWHNFRGRGGRAGTSADGRRHAGARRVVRRRDSVLAAAFAAARAGKAVSARVLAAETGVALRTVQRYLRIVAARLKQAAPQILPSGSAAAGPSGSPASSEVPQTLPAGATDPPGGRKPTGSG